MREKLTAQLVLEGFSPLDSNLPEFRVFLKREFSHVNVIFTIDLEKDSACTREQYDTVHRTAVELLQKQGLHMDLHILTICLAADVNYALNLCGHDKRVWIIDKNRNRLIIPEGKLADFYGMKDRLEAFLQDPEVPVREIAQLKEVVRKEISKRNVPRKMYVPYVTVTILILNVIIFAINIFLQNSLWDMGGLDLRVLREGQWYRLLTSAFLHLDIYHLFNNMLILYMAGNMLERILGRSMFAIFYVTGILASGLSSLIYHAAMQDYALCIGASGGAYALLGAVIMILLAHPRNYNKGMFIRLLLMLVCVGIGIVEGFRNPGVDNVAHVGGICFGAIAMLLFILFKRHKKEGNRNED